MAVSVLVDKELARFRTLDNLKSPPISPACMDQGTAPLGRGFLEKTKFRNQHMANMAPAAAEEQACTLF